MRREAAAAVAEQHADVAALVVGRHQVQLAVVVEVANGDRLRMGAGGEVGMSPEAAVAVA